MADWLRVVLGRADSREAAFTADEVAGWPGGLAGRLVGLGLLREGTPERALACDACGGDHVEELVWLPSPGGAPARTFLPCPVAGRVPVPPERLRRWEIDLGRLAAVVAGALGCGPAAEVVRGRLWRLGKLTLAGARREAFLARGLGWPDAVGAVAGARRLASAVRPLVLAAGSLPPAGAWPREPQPVPLDAVLSLDGDEPAFDRALLEGRPAGDAPAAAGQAGGARPRRMTREAANERAMELARADRSFVRGGLRDWARAIGCSPGLVARLPFWRQTMGCTGHGRRGRGVPKAVGLTGQLEAVLGEDDEELRRLIEEHRADSEPSPLDADAPHARPRRVRTRKRP